MQIKQHESCGGEAGVIWVIALLVGRRWFTAPSGRVKHHRPTNGYLKQTVCSPNT